MLVVHLKDWITRCQVWFWCLMYGNIIHHYMIMLDLPYKGFIVPRLHFGAIVVRRARQTFFVKIGFKCFWNLAVKFKMLKAFYFTKCIVYHHQESTNWQPYFSKLNVGFLMWLWGLFLYRDLRYWTANQHKKGKIVW